MKKGWVLTQEAFDSLLVWLDVDPRQAGAKYEQIQRTLIRTFATRECADPEGLADETINRVISKLPEIVDTYTGPKELYFYSVAKLILKEYKRKSQKTLSISPVEPEKVPEKIPESYYFCLEECLGKLPQADRDMILEYYNESKQAKIDSRKLLAEKLGISVETLRMRVTRIKRKLKICLSERIEKEDSW